MPLARVVGPITERLQIVRQHAGPCRQPALRRVHADLLGVVAGQQAGPRRPAAGRGIHLREAQAAGGQFVQVGRSDLAAVAAGIGEAHVIGKYYYDIRYTAVLRADCCVSGVYRQSEDGGGKHERAYSV